MYFAFLTNNQSKTLALRCVNSPRNHRLVTEWRTMVSRNSVYLFQHLIGIRYPAKETAGCMKIELSAGLTQPFKVIFAPQYINNTWKYTYATMQSIDGAARTFTDGERTARRLSWGTNRGDFYPLTVSRERWGKAGSALSPFLGQVAWRNMTVVPPTL